MSFEGLTGGAAYSKIGVNVKTKSVESCEDFYSPRISRKESFLHWLRSRWALYFGRLVHEWNNRLRLLKTWRSASFVILDRVFGQIAETITNSTPNRVHSEKRPNPTQQLMADVKLRIGSFFYSFWINRRLRAGFFLLLIIAPASRFVYLIFPENGFGEFLVSTSLVQIPNFLENTDGFYGSIYWWSMVCGELWSTLIAIFGMFLLFPRGYYPAYVTGVPFGYYLSLLLHRVTVTSNEEFHQGFTPGVVSMLVVLGVVVLVLSDRMLFNENHRKRASEARIIGLINTPGIDWKEKEELLKKEAKEWMKNDNELFNRTG